MSVVVELACAHIALTRAAVGRNMPRSPISLHTATSTSGSGAHVCRPRYARLRGPTRGPLWPYTIWALAMRVGRRGDTSICWQGHYVTVGLGRQAGVCGV